MPGEKEKGARWSVLSRAMGLWDAIDTKTIDTKTIDGVSAVLSLSREKRNLEWCPGTELNRRHEDFQSSTLHIAINGLRGAAPLRRGFAGGFVL
jgi:hypothetical protein